MNSVIDLIIRIKNGYMAKKPNVTASFSKVKQSVLELLAKEGYVESFDIEVDGVKKTFNIVLKYVNGKSKFTDLSVVSRPGQRQYIKKSEIPFVLNGLGIGVLSTNKGVITNREAKKLNVGGEFMFKIW